MSMYARDIVRASQAGAGLINLSRTATDAITLQTYTIKTVAALNVTQSITDIEIALSQQIDPSTGDYYEVGGETEPIIITPDVYPATLTLTPNATRQLKVHVTDPNTGATIDIHTASQTTFAGSPATTETYTDPDTGEVTVFNYDALAPVYSGTRYVVSDERIATVSADGLITAHLAGKVRRSICAFSQCGRCLRQGGRTSDWSK